MAQLMSSLRRVDGGWIVDGASDLQAELAAEAPRSIEKAATAEDIRAVVDVLAERALEGTSATGVYSTPGSVAKLMSALLDSPDGRDVRSVLDPACGSGTLLLAAAEAGATELYGQDVLAVQVQRTRLLVEASMDLEPVVRHGDSLTTDAFEDLKVDAVLCNPPYGQRDWGSGELAFDTRWSYGPPPRVESELAWAQHAVAHLRPGGTAIMLLPPAVATRPSGRKIRTNLVRTGTLRAVIGLAPGTAQPWHVGLQLWVLRPRQTDGPTSDAILFVDTTGLPAKADGTEGVDWDVLNDRVLRSWRAFDSPNPDAAVASGVAAVVRLVDVLDDEVDLTPVRYVRASLDSESVVDNVDDVIRGLTTAVTELTSVTGALGGWSAAGSQSWRFVPISDLMTHGQLTWIKSDLPSTDQQVADDMSPVLTAPDIATGSPASGTLSSIASEKREVVEDRDVLIPAVRSDRTGGRSARVAGPEDAGVLRGPHVHTLRVDEDRLDPWFLAGFLTGAENISATRTATVRFDPTRLRIPVLSLAEQRRYGDVFRQLFLLRTAARRATYAAEHVAELVTTGLTVGVLAPESDLDTGRDRT
ncbi:N-6 DNA methylase [Nocardia sp. NBC_01388]|uniref:N-6 DNA methylase n=1 Tax=Nocardia sp. NBC_01388 TaxID=2903596 RepID=UPI00325351CA